MNDLFARILPPAMTRFALGLLLLVAGLKKFFGPGPEGFMNWILKEFAATPLPPWSLAPYGFALPFIEVALGLFLIVGLFHRAALVATAGLLLSLGFGKMLLGDHQTVAQIFLYLLIAAWTMKNGEEDQLTLDHLFSG
jgi:thiosulfate dehydrogenase [quinone] large subunit